jgi:hypothetical protein
VHAFALKDFRAPLTTYTGPRHEPVALDKDFDFLLSREEAAASRPLALNFSPPRRPAFPARIQHYRACAQHGDRGGSRAGKVKVDVFR